MITYKPKDFAKLLGVSVNTLQRWDRNGTLIAYRTPTNRRYYTEDQYYLKTTNGVLSVIYGLLRSTISDAEKLSAIETVVMDNLHESTSQTTSEG